MHDKAFVMKTFYSSLYSRKSAKTEKECFDYPADINTPALSEDDQTLCDGQIRLNEIFGALNNMASNKTPGNDGLSKEFYLAFFDLLGPRLSECLNKVFLLGEFSNGLIIRSKVSWYEKGEKSNNAQGNFQYGVIKAFFCQ